jgi:hypothetical protein
MKRIFSLIIALALTLGILSGCATTNKNNSGEPAPEATLADAIAELDKLYKSENGTSNTSDYTLVGSVKIGDKTFEVFWTTDNEKIDITETPDGTFNVNLPSKNDEAMIYLLVATVTDDKGDREVYSFTKNLPVFTASGNKPTPPAQDNGSGDVEDGGSTGDSSGDNNTGNNGGNTGDTGNTGNTGSGSTGSGNTDNDNTGSGSTSGKDIDGTYTYTFSGVVFESNGTQTLGGIEWTLDGNGGFWGFDTRGHQFGSKKNPYEYLTLTSETINGIKEIRIEMIGASGFAGNIFVYVDGVQVDQPNDVDDTAKTFIFDSAKALNGEIEIEILASTARAIYIKSITIVCE